MIRSPRGTAMALLANRSFFAMSGCTRPPRGPAAGCGRPAAVYLGEGDQRIRLDLASPHTTPCCATT